MTTLILVRHGETDWNFQRRIQGTTDIPLNDTGREQARETGRRLAEQLSGEAPVIVSSDLGRAAETADLIAGELGAVVTGRYVSLRERAYGQAEGVTFAEFQERWGGWHDAEVPEAEELPALRARAIAAVREVVADARGDRTPESPVVIAVTHGALIRELIRHATNGELPAEGQRLANGATYTFLVERERLSLRAYTETVPSLV